MCHRVIVLKVYENVTRKFPMLAFSNVQGYVVLGQHDDLGKIKLKVL